MLFRNRQLEDIRDIMTSNSGGVYKRVDETRELLELLQQQAPAFVAAHPWVAAWLDSNDGFLCALAEALPVSGARFMPVEGQGAMFPRPKPVAPQPESLPASVPVDLASMAADVHRRANEAMFACLLATFQAKANDLGICFTRDRSELRAFPNVIEKAELGQAIIKAKLRFVAPLADTQWAAERGHRDEEDLVWCDTIIAALEAQGVYMTRSAAYRLETQAIIDAALNA